MPYRDYSQLLKLWEVFCSPAPNPRVKELVRELRGGSEYQYQIELRAKLGLKIQSFDDELHGEQEPNLEQNPLAGASSVQSVDAMEGASDVSAAIHGYDGPTSVLCAQYHGETSWLGLGFPTQILETGWLARGPGF